MQSVKEKQVLKKTTVVRKSDIQGIWRGAKNKGFVLSDFLTFLQNNGDFLRSCRTLGV